MIIVTGATGKLGQHVIKGLLGKMPGSQIGVAVRSPDKAQDLADSGVEVRQADYSKPETLSSAFVGAEQVLLISSSELGQRAAQHRAVVDAVKKAGVKLLAYTSLLRADTSTISLAPEHLESEKYIRDSGIPFVILRNGWYLENHTEALAPALQHGVILGAAGEGRFASAARADFAEAAVAVLTSSGHVGKIYELAGDQSYTLTEAAALVSKRSGKSVVYKNMPPKEYEGALAGMGLPGPLAAMLASADAGVARGEMDDTSHTLSKLIGRPTTTLERAVDDALASSAH